MRIAALLTCHNRRSQTVACLDSLAAQKLPEDCELVVYLVDDGSTDGTGEAVRQAHPGVRVLQGDGTLYWNGGMRLAFDAAYRDGHDAFLWINDDTVLYEGSLEGLIATYRQRAAFGDGPSILVGSTRDPTTGEHTYGGVVRASRWHPLKFGRVEPCEEPVRCLTMNGNCVLIPREVAERVGNLDPAFPHAIADLDYGLRATAQGCTVWVAPGYVGTCSRNSPDGMWEDRQLPLVERLRKVRNPKGLPPGAWRVFARRHAGPLWMVYWLLPYVRLLVTSGLSVVSALRGGRGHRGSGS